jgi:hypothetical protein
MNKVLITGLLVFFVFFGVSCSKLEIKEREHTLIRTVEDFSRFQVNTFPEGWKSRGGDGAEIYRIRSDMGMYLEAKAEDAAVTIAKAFEYDLRKYPVLTWQWKAVTLPQGGDERYKETGDSAAGIYVIFSDLGIPPKNIKYVWSASLPVGTVTNSPYNNDTIIVVLQNHLSPLHSWISETVNVYKDYKRFFGEEPEGVQAIGILSDSDNTNSLALAHYRNISISPENEL